MLELSNFNFNCTNIEVSTTNGMVLPCSLEMESCNSVSYWCENLVTVTKVTVISKAKRQKSLMNLRYTQNKTVMDACFQNHLVLPQWGLYWQKKYFESNVFLLSQLHGGIGFGEASIDAYSILWRSRQVNIVNSIRHYILYALGNSS